MDERLTSVCGWMGSGRAGGDGARASRASAFAGVALAACIAGAASVLGGCTEPLLTPDEPRSQYDRTDAVRDRRAPSYVVDEFGTRRPNIRGRLVRSE